MHNLILAALFLPVWFGFPAGYRDGPVIESHPAEYAFGQEMVFTASVQSSEPLQSAQLMIRTGFSRSVSYPASIAVSGDYLLSVRRDLAVESLFPFAPVEYWWEAVSSTGRKAQSGLQTIQYSDDRFAWNRLEKGRAVVEWTEGGSGEAEDAAELILLALGTVSADLEAPIPQKVSLYLYPRLADLHSAVGTGLRGWEGAVSDPSSGIILLAAASGAEGRRPLAVLLPHEVTHVLLGEKWGSAYALLPRWLVEGTAAGYEMEGRPEADQALRDAAAAGNLIPMRALCGVFPAEENPAQLAYAESKSFVAFLKQTYGMAVLRQAMALYADGADCGGGLKASTGETLEDLESAWSKTLGAGKAWISPAWALVLAGMVLLAGVLAVRWLIQGGRIKFLAKKEEEG